MESVKPYLLLAHRILLMQPSCVIDCVPFLCLGMIYYYRLCVFVSVFVCLGMFVSVFVYVFGYVCVCIFVMFEYVFVFVSVFLCVFVCLFMCICSGCGMINLFKLLRHSCRYLLLVVVVLMVLNTPDIFTRMSF